MLTISFTVIAFCTTASFVAGIIDSIAGGGGLITLPAILISGVPPHFALGTNKFAATIGTSVAVANFARSHLVQWRMALWGLGFTLAGSWAGAMLTQQFDSAQLGKILVLLLPFAMLTILLPMKDSGKNQSLPCDWRFWILLPATCFVLGAYDGFFGPGTGSFLILAFYWMLGTGLLAASATAKVINLASNIGAFFVFLWNGQILWPLAFAMAAGSMLGNWLGSRLAIKIGPALVRKILLLSLLILLATLIWRYFLAPAGQDIG